MSALTSFFIEYFFASVVLYTGYRILRKWISPNIRRYFLLAVVTLPLVFPLVHFPSYTWIRQADPLHGETGALASPPTVLERIPDEHMPSTDHVSSDERAFDESQDWRSFTSLSTIITGIYLLVSLLLFIRFLVNLIIIFRLIYRSKVAVIDSSRVNLVESNHFAGANFFQWILLNSAYLKTHESKTIVAHEKIHRENGHSFDSLLCEINLILTWLNPVSWFTANEVRLNNELIADEWVSNAIGRDTYLNRLVAISLNYPKSMLQLFSALSIKRRIKHLTAYQSTNWHRVIPILLLFLLLAFLPVACTDPLDRHEMELADKSLKNIKKITTTYLSHQEDTQEKDDQIVSIAYYNEDQTLQRLDNYTSYPYTSVEPKTREFMGNPMTYGLFIIMDGLTLEHAELNFLFGNDWPRIMAKKTQNGILPETRALGETTYRVDYEKGDFPREILTRWIPYANHEVTLSKGFIYEDDRISRLILNQRMPVGGQSSNKTKSSTGLFRDEVVYIYNGDQLVRMDWGKKSWTFRYEGDLLVETVFLINEKRFNQRKYFYNNQGLKTRTEIFNAFEEPEYTILYSYEYYPEKSS